MDPAAHCRWNGGMQADETEKTEEISHSPRVPRAPRCAGGMETVALVRIDSGVARPRIEDEDDDDQGAGRQAVAAESRRDG